LQYTRCVEKKRAGAPRKGFCVNGEREKGQDDQLFWVQELDRGEMKRTAFGLRVSLIVSTIATSVKDNEDKKAKHVSGK
jgi:hypothetical protein